MQEQKGKLSKKKIKEQIFAELEDLGFHVTNVNVGDGYYLFDMGKNSVVHFSIKEIRKWRFGIWITDDKEKKEYNVSLFGDKIRWIDKFKPSATPISTKDTVPFAWNDQTRGHYSDVGFIVWHIYDQLAKLKYNRHIGEYALHRGYDSFMSFVWNEFWWYDICKPLKKFYENHVVEKVYGFVLWTLGLKYHKYVKLRPVRDRNDDFNGWSVSPRYETGVEYRKDLTDEELMFNVWRNIEESWQAKFLNKETSFQQFKDSEAKRGFYYQAYYDWKKQQQEQEEEEKK